MKRIVHYTVLILFGVLLFFPIGYALSISFMSAKEIFSGSLLPEQFTLTNYEKAFNKVPLLQYLWNSLLVSTIIMIAQVIFASLAAFAFVFVPFRGRSIVFALFIGTLLIPWEATMIPNVQTIQALGWRDSYLGLTVPFFASVFGTFLLRQHFRSIPYELFEASQVCGVRRFSFFLRVALPYSRTSLITLAIYNFLSAWNMYLWPLLITNDEKYRTVQIGLKQMQAVEVASEWGVIMAGVVMIIIPSLLLLWVGQKGFQKGLVQGAIK
ncbi:MAG: carbohydrate ABC transporter permease [Bacilli bacterium]